MLLTEGEEEEEEEEEDEDEGRNTRPTARHPKIIDLTILASQLELRVVRSSKMQLSSASLCGFMLPVNKEFHVIFGLR